MVCRWGSSRTRYRDPICFTWNWGGDRHGRHGCIKPRQPASCRCRIRSRRSQKFLHEMNVSTPFFSRIFWGLESNFGAWFIDSIQYIQYIYMTWRKVFTTWICSSETQVLHRLDTCGSHVPGTLWLACLNSRGVGGPLLQYTPWKKRDASILVQKSGDHPLFTDAFFLHPRWVFTGFLNHQQNQVATTVLFTKFHLRPSCGPK